MSLATFTPFLARKAYSKAPTLVSSLSKFKLSSLTNKSYKNVWKLKSMNKYSMNQKPYFIPSQVQNRSMVTQAYDLYRTSHQPWDDNALTSQPELAEALEEVFSEALKEGRIEHAKGLYQRYMAKGVMPLTQTWHSYVIMCYKTGDWLNMKSLFRSLILNGVVPDVHAWNFLLDIVAKNELINHSEETFWNAFMHLKGELNEFSYQTLFKVHFNAKNYSYALNYYIALTERGYTIPDRQLEVLKSFSREHRKSFPNPDALIELPAEDRKQFDIAFRRDSLLLGREFLDIAAQTYSPQGRETWKKAIEPNSKFTADVAFSHALADSRLHWDKYVSEALGLDHEIVHLVRVWDALPQAKSVSPNAVRLLTIPLNETKKALVYVQMTDPFNLEASLLNEDKSVASELDVAEARKLLKADLPHKIYMKYAEPRPL